MSERRTRSLLVNEALVRAYSRQGNYHSEPTTAAQLGLPGLVAQGTQAAGPASGLMLDAWGEDFLAHGEIDVKFVGMVMAGDAVDAHVDFDEGKGDGARLAIQNVTAGYTAVVGHARRRHEPM